ncbi:MAG: amidohydrolase [Chloroflexi bacterium]|nr:amidohydrolase [Chloroflexota bacterium]MBV9542817.1 amidohydrolase [Chloroflexota bacterium]
MTTSTRIVDLHAYPGTDTWVRSQGPYPEFLSRYWGHAWTPRTEPEVISDFTAANVQVVLVAFDIESQVGAPPCDNQYVASMRDRYPRVIRQAWGAVDPFKGEEAILQAEHAIKQLNLLGFHFHPIMGRFAVDDQRLYPLWETINALKVPAMIDVGTTGMGAGMPGGSGTRIRYAHPAAIDGLAADFPNLQIVMAHPGWPWVEETIAVALHKGNVSWELSGWAPKYFPDSVRREIRGRLKEKIMFGSDYPSLPYERIFREWSELGFSDDILERVFHKNAERILGL